MQGSEAELCQKFAPKFAARACAFLPRKIPKSTRPSRPETFAVVKTFWMSAPVLTPKILIDGKQDDNQDRDQVLRVQADIHAPEQHGADGKFGHFPEMDDPMAGGNGRPEDAEKFAESHAHGGNRARLDDEEQSPAVEKSPERAERFAQVDVLPAGARHHGGEFAVGERADDGEESGDQPRRRSAARAN